MYPLISVWSILPGKEIMAAAALDELAAAVELTEPHTLAYLVHRPDLSQASLPTPPACQVVFYEIYQNREAFIAHINGIAFQAFLKKAPELFLYNGKKTEPYSSLEIFSLKAGFIRSDVLPPKDI